MAIRSIRVTFCERNECRVNDQPERPRREPGEWIRYAEGDLSVAEREMRYQAPAYHTICFLWQSAAEEFGSLSRRHCFRAHPESGSQRPRMRHSAFGRV
jgi:hypothetical protein